MDKLLAKLTSKRPEAPALLTADFKESNESAFETLPDELILLIFSYIEPFFVSRTLTLVCKRFANVLWNDQLWKFILYRSLNRISNSIDNLNHLHILKSEAVNWTCGRDLLWRDLAVQLDILDIKWRQNDDKILCKTLNRHYASVDAVKIVGDDGIIVSCGRDRSICLWKVDLENLNTKVESIMENSHGGWIWDIDSCTPETFFTCSFDNYVSYWGIDDSVRKLNSFNCGKPVMAVSCTRGLIAAGLHVPSIVLIDPRISMNQSTPNSIATFKIHRHTVTDVLLVPEKNLLLSISEDKSLIFFDLRQQRVCFKRIKITNSEAFPRCLSYNKEVIYIGDSRGNVHLYSLDGDRSNIYNFNIGTDTRLVTSVIIPKASEITIGSTDCHVKIFYQSDPPTLIWDYIMHGEVTSVDQHRNLLVVGSASNSVNVIKSIDV